MVTRLKCPEFSSGAVEGTLVVLSISGVLGIVRVRDEDAGTPAGVLTVRERVTGGIAALNHRLPAGKPPASSNCRLRRRKETPKSESECVEMKPEVARNRGAISFRKILEVKC